MIQYMKKYIMYTYEHQVLSFLRCPIIYIPNEQRTQHEEDLLNTLHHVSLQHR